MTHPAWLASLSLGCAGCYAALAPPTPPVFHGAVTADGGALGNWQLAIRAARPVDAPDLVALDLFDPAHPGPVIRLIATGGGEQPAARAGIVERIVPRNVELRARTGKHEVVLGAAQCTRLDAIFEVTGPSAFGSARFDCDLGADGRLAGNFEIQGGADSPFSTMSGQIAASDRALAATELHPDRAITDPTGVVFWDRAHPRVVFQLDVAPTDPSGLGAGSNAKLRVISTARSVASFDIAPETCRVLRWDRRDVGFVRIGTHQHTSWAGKIEIDCPTPGGGRLTGALEVSS